MDPRIAARRAQVGRSDQRAALQRLAKLFGVTIVVAALVWFVYSPFLDVDDIVVGGAVASDVPAVLAELGVDEGDPLLLVPAGRLEREIGADPWVRSVAVSRIVPGRLEISVVERLPALAVEEGATTSIVALDGMVLSLAGSRPDDLPVYLDGASQPGTGEMVENGPVLGVLQFLQEFGPVTPLARFEVVDTEMWLRLPTHDVRLGRPIDMAAKAASLRAVLADNPETGTVIVLIAPDRPTLQDPQPQLEG